MTTPQSPVPNPETEDFITPQQAAPRLDAAIQPYLEEGWRVADRSSYLIRLRRDDQLLDVQIDLTGNLTTSEKMAVQTAAEIGRLIAWLFLLVSMVFVLIAAYLLGLL